MIYDDTTNGVDNADIYPKLDGLINDIKRKFEINEELNFVIIDDYPSGPDLGVQRKYKFNYRSKKGSTLDNVLIITKGIFKIMNSDELEMLIAHEFSHIKNKDTTALNYIRKKYLSLIIIPPVLGIVLGAGVELVIKYNLLAASLIIISYFIIAALEGARAYNSKKRSIETRADEDALNVMLNPDALRNAIEKINDTKKLNPNKLIYLSWKIFYFFVGHTHPSPAERIINIEKWKEQNKPIKGT